MPTIPAQLEIAFRQAIQTALGVEADPLISVSQNEKFGDYQSNAAMGLTKVVAERTGQKTNPRQVAEQIKAQVEPLLGKMASEVTIAGPGFINVRLSPVWVAEQLRAADQTPHLGIEPASRRQRVVVDYSGPNIAKEMHVGHLRSTIIGDAIARVLEFQNHEVIRQNHIGDWGTQFGMLITHLKKSAGESSAGKMLSKQVESLGRPENGLGINDLEQFYREAKECFDADSEFQDESRRNVVRLQAGEPDERRIWQEIVNETRRHYQPVYERLGVKLKPENERGESYYNDLLPSVVADLKKEGVAVESEGAVVVPVEGYSAPLIIEKTGGGYLYGTTDLAAIRYRCQELKADRIIYTHDARQTQHFNQVFAAARKAGFCRPDVALEFAPFGTMLGKDGKPFKTRAGGTVKLKDLLDEAEERALTLVTEKNPDLPADQRQAIARAVGIGAVKYSDLSKDRLSDYVFDWDKMLSLDGNTAPYLQYAYARIRSIFRKAGEQVSRDFEMKLESPFEQALAKHVLRLPEIINLVARELKPHHLCTYLYELATRFSAFYENCPVLQSEEPLRSSRLVLCDATATTMACGLDLLGIEHPEQM